ncbi:phosphoribosylformylglycinamidine cyclo-ligase [Loigolactobacillus backii]|uniref:phosphoribosylformylglycinamidine cyclo-ligase n=1 Tax=Loigolactobacillus backii TaxID=375175 RepID=UPI000C1C913C|nr:phosphoribosylformylglycinamidine cyclo-ligase [Loigolactobacillus backii]PIO82267.1 phosphoribosylformylglycinamidine cyclo-ligase [Loigolactobacillus backii]
MDAYKKAGVDIAAGNQVVTDLKKLSGNQALGSFGGLFPLDLAGYKRPVLVSGADGVGTKLLVAQKAQEHATIGIDLVAMCVNDIVAQGAQPLFFLDYLGVGHLQRAQTQAILKGIVAGCQDAQVQLVGGETAEMPDMYQAGHYDLAGFAVGIAEAQQLMQPEKMALGDILLGLPAQGLHSNGFSLVRQILFKQHHFELSAQLPHCKMDLAHELLRPTKIYVKALLPLVQQNLVSGIAHITGGGLLENVARILPTDLDAVIDCSTWTLPGIMQDLASLGQLSFTDLASTFNLGIGMVLAVHPKNLGQVKQALAERQQPVLQIGQVTTGQQKVILQEQK